MKILLISPNLLTDPYPVYPIGLDYVAGAVSKNHQVRIVDMNNTGKPGLKQILKDYAPELIGLSCRNIDNTEAANSCSFIEDYRQIVAWLRKHSSAIIVCGGSGFTIMPEPFFTALGADYGIIGEGERFGPFIDALYEGRDVSTLAGIISSRPPRPHPPPWEGEPNRIIKPSFSHYQFYLDNGGMLNLQTKRGCTFRCIYCPYPHIEGNQHRLFDPEKIAETALQLQEIGAKYLFITDSIFNSDVKHSLAVAKSFRKIGLAIPWGGFFTPLKLEPDYFTIMKDCGLKHVEFGTESLSESVLRSYRKPFQVKEVFAAHRQAREAGLHVAHYFLLGGPGESESTVKESLDNIMLLDRTVLFFFIGMRIYPNTGLYDLACAEGKISADTDLLEPVFYESSDIARNRIEELVSERANGKSNWIIGSGGEKSATALKKMYDRKFTGPLWEYLAK